MSNILEKWYPVTSDFGLIEASLDRVSEACQNWWRGIGKDVGVQCCKGTLDEQFQKLAPLSIAKHRTLLLPTASMWTAFFRNGIQGSDPASALPYLGAELAVRCMRICVTTTQSRYPAVIWEVHDPATASDRPGLCRRSIAAANDGGRWVFEQSGDPFEFEKTERYSSGKKSARFDRELLLEYVSHFGIPSLDDTLFATANPSDGVLISFPPWEGAKSYSLEETRAGVPWQRS
jgi:hypothetical protein